MTWAMRRHHRERIKRARRHYWGRDRALTPGQLGIVVDTPHPCSCLLCANRRKHIGETIQELRTDKPGDWHKIIGIDPE